MNDIHQLGESLKDSKNNHPVGTALSVVRSQRSHQSAFRSAAKVGSSSPFESQSVIGINHNGEYQKKIGKILNKNLDAIKDALKKADQSKLGSLDEDSLRHVMLKFNIVLPSLDKFKKADQVDYIKFLKYYL